MIHMNIPANYKANDFVGKLSCPSNKARMYRRRSQRIYLGGSASTGPHACCTQVASANPGLGYKSDIRIYTHAMQSVTTLMSWIHPRRVSFLVALGACLLIPCTVQSQILAVGYFESAA